MHAFAPAPALQGVCNRDIKQENTLLFDSGPRVKICDFGYSKV